MPIKRQAKTACIASSNIEIYIYIYIYIKEQSSIHVTAKTEKLIDEINIGEGPHPDLTKFHNIK